MSPTIDTRIGSVELGTFRILRRLGEGSFATAYLAEQIGTERLAVLKIARSERLASGTTAKEAFAREVRAATRVAHPNLVSIYVAGETKDGSPAYAMEYVPGFTLEARMTRCSFLPIRELDFYFSQVARALKKLHAASIVHRDLSPNNVIVSLDDEGQPKATLLDLGVAILQDLGDGSGEIAGTARYIAPEQLGGSPRPASDMFALGSLIYFGVTGGELFGEAATLSELLLHTVHLAAPPDPRRERPDLPEPMARLVMSLLEPNPDKRPTASDFLDRWPVAMRSMVDAAAKPTVPMRRPLVLTKPRSPKLLAIRVHPEVKPVVTKRAGMASWEVEFADDARAATRAQEGRYDGFLLPADLESPSTRAVAHHLREFHPNCPIILALGKGEEVESLDFRPHLIVRLPEDANGLWFFLQAITPEADEDEEDFSPVPISQ